MGEFEIGVQKYVDLQSVLHLIHVATPFNAHAQKGKQRVASFTYYLNLVSTLFKVSKRVCQDMQIKNQFYSYIHNLE